MKKTKTEKKVVKKNGKAVDPKRSEAAKRAWITIRAKLNQKNHKTNNK